MKKYLLSVIAAFSFVYVSVAAADCPYPASEPHNFGADCQSIVTNCGSLSEPLRSACFSAQFGTLYQAMASVIDEWVEFHECLAQQFPDDPYTAAVGQYVFLMLNLMSYLEAYL